MGPALSFAKIEMARKAGMVRSVAALRTTLFLRRRRNGERNPVEALEDQRAHRRHVDPPAGLAPAILVGIPGAGPTALGALVGDDVALGGLVPLPPVRPVGPVQD